MTSRAYQYRATCGSRRGNLCTVVLWSGILSLAATTSIQAQIRSFMAADGEQGSAPTTGNTSLILLPGESRQVMVWLEDSSGPGDTLGGYQLVFFSDAAPLGVATGTVDYVDNDPGGGGGDTIFIDSARTDWVLMDQPILPPNYLENDANGIFGVFYGTSFGLGTDPGDTGGILYMAQFELQASADACGQFEFVFKTEQGTPPTPRTSFFTAFGGQYVVDELQTLTVTVPCECLVGPDCADGDLCTDDVCTDFMCSNPAVDCSGLDDQCLAGVCNPVDGQCVTEPANEGGGCDDGEPCTELDICTAGECGGSAVDCSDDNACTADVCDPKSGECSNPQMVFCDDDDVCNGLETCDPGNGECSLGTPLMCDDGMFCNGAETCDAIAGCQPGTAPCQPPADICDEDGQLCLECVGFSDCADQNGDDVRDDGCVWWACQAGSCQGTDIVYADLGGEFGACPPDGTTDANDRFQALNCFSDQTTGGQPGYPCEDAPPAAYNVDAAGLQAPCDPDGVCDANDAFAALNAFEDNTTCSCPLGGPQPSFSGPPPLAASTSVLLERGSRRVGPGDTLAIDVFLGEGLQDLRGYQVHLGSGGGKRGSLRLVDIMVEHRADEAFFGQPAWRAYNIETGQMLSGLDVPGVEVRAGAYLATFIYEVSADAVGTFVVELLHDRSDAGQRTVLFPTTFNGRIDIESASAAVVEVSSKARSRRSR